MKRSLPAVFALAGSLTAALAQTRAPAPAPRTLAFTGILRAANGAPLPDGPRPVTFRFYDAPTGGTLLHAETDSVALNGGLFTATLGDPEGLPVDVRLDRPVYIGVQVGGDPEMSPRHALSPAPLALALPGVRTEPVRDGAMQREAINVIGGHGSNTVAPGVFGATIAGGGIMTGGADLGNTVYMNHGTIGGGIGNTVGSWDYVPDGHGSGTVGGGSGNEAAATGSTVAGGISNAAIGTLSSVGGGYTNFAPGASSVISGGDNNRADGRLATVGGGAANYAEGEAAAIPGGEGNRATGASAFAAGRAALAQHDGAFVWSDRAPGPTESTATNQFTVRATGGVRFITGARPDGAPLAGAELAPGSGSWSSLSDRHAKTDLEAVDPQRILDRLATLPLTTWRYTTQPEGIRHIGPMAQDFHAAFGVGEDARHISAVDADGVALAAIQGLLRIVRAQEARLRALEGK